jgi:hypothetical protein
MEESATSDPEAILRDTAWGILEHGQGSAFDTPDALRGLLSGDPVDAAAAVRHVEQVVNHQNTVFSAMPPVVRYVAAILADPRTMIEGVFRRDQPPQILRVTLLEWLATVAEDISDASRDIARRHGVDPEEMPAEGELRDLRPALYITVERYLNDPARPVADAAHIAAAALLDDGEEVRRRGLLPRLREIAAASSGKRRRAGAFDLLAVEGELSEQAPPF